MSFDSFVILPAHVFKTQQRLAEYKEFFEPQLSDLALSRNIGMGIKEIAWPKNVSIRLRERIICAMLPLPSEFSKS